MDYKLTNITTPDRVLKAANCLEDSCDDRRLATAEDAIQHVTTELGHVVEVTWITRELLVVGQTNWAQTLPAHHVLPQTEPGS